MKKDRKDIREITDSQIAAMIKRYRTAGTVDGLYYSLAELLMEERRRKPSAFPYVEVARRVIEFAKASADGKTTYLELWNEFAPDQPWQANASIRKVGGSLGRVIEYCVRHGLPILTVLVVQSGSRRLSPEAVMNIYNEARELGVDVGLDPAAFVARETDRSLAFLSSNLPNEA